MSCLAMLSYLSYFSKPSFVFAAGADAAMLAKQQALMLLGYEKETEFDLKLQC